MELLVVHGGVLYLHGGGKLGLVGCDGAGRGGQSVSVMKKVGGTSCKEGMGGGFGSELVEVDMVRQWSNHLTRISLPLVAR